MNMQITEIAPGVHQLPGIGKIEYVYTSNPKQLVINANGNELGLLTGVEALKIGKLFIGLT